MLNDYEVRQTVMNMRNKVVLLEREGEYWSDEERDQIRCLFESGTGLTTIAMILQRTEMAVIQQGMLMNLFSPPHIRKQHVHKPPRCRCPNCKVDPAQCPHRQASATLQLQEVPHAV